MVVQRLEALTSNPELLAWAKLALRAVHEWNTTEGGYRPSQGEIGDYVAIRLTGNENKNGDEDFDLDALNRERGRFRNLGVINFLSKWKFIEALVPGAYWVLPEVRAYCPRLYQ